MRKTLLFSSLLALSFTSASWAQGPQPSQAPATQLSTQTNTQSPTPPPQNYDPRLIESQMATMKSLLDLRDNQLRVLTEDAKRLHDEDEKKYNDLNESWKQAFDKWCGNQPNCGKSDVKVEPHPAPTQSPSAPSQPR